MVKVGELGFFGMGQNLRVYDLRLFLTPFKGEGLCTEVAFALLAVAIN